jgi:hypothetical protein
MQGLPPRLPGSKVMIERQSVIMVPFFRRIIYFDSPIAGAWRQLAIAADQQD